MNDGLPASVRAGAEKAEALVKQLNETPGEGDPGVATPDEPAKNTSTADPSKPGATDPEAKATPTPDSKPTPAKPEEETFKARYFTLKGKYDADMNRLNDGLRTLQQQVDQLTEENTSLKAGNDKNTDLQGTGNTEKGRLDPDSMAEYGPEFQTMAAKMNELIDENQTLKEQLGQVNEKVGTVEQAQGQTDYETYIGRVAQQVQEAGGNFNQLNSDPAFLAWLSDIHPYTNQPRHASLQDAERHFDVVRTVRIFSEYLDSLNTEAQPETPPVEESVKEPAQQQAPQPAQPNIQPTHRPSGSDVTPPNPASGRIWTRASVKKLYMDKAAGLYRGKEADFKALEADMFRAQNEGRIQS
ncbi:MAG: hypothetical protein GY737_13875 [Desulfobacteraceae bacterium]|nr:hypothetical protein [Desulfobacteraceae bacterium]